MPTLSTELDMDLMIDRIEDEFRELLAIDYIHILAKLEIDLGVVVYDLSNGFFGRIRHGTLLNSGVCQTICR